MYVMNILFILRVCIYCDPWRTSLVPIFINCGLLISECTRKVGHIKRNYYRNKSSPLVVFWQILSAIEQNLSPQVTRQLWCFKTNIKINTETNRNCQISLGHIVTCMVMK